MNIAQTHETHHLRTANRLAISLSEFMFRYAIHSSFFMASELAQGSCAPSLALSADINGACTFQFYLLKLLAEQQACAWTCS